MHIAESRQSLQFVIWKNLKFIENFIRIRGTFIEITYSKILVLFCEQFLFCSYFNSYFYN